MNCPKPEIVGLWRMNPPQHQHLAAGVVRLAAYMLRSLLAQLIQRRDVGIYQGHWEISAADGRCASRGPRILLTNLIACVLALQVKGVDGNTFLLRKFVTSSFGLGKGL